MGHMRMEITLDPIFGDVIPATVSVEDVDAGMRPSWRHALAFAMRIAA